MVKYLIYPIIKCSLDQVPICREGNSLGDTIGGDCIVDSNIFNLTSSLAWSDYEI